MANTTHQTIRGLIAPILTPFNDDLTIADDLFLDHAKRMLAEGCAGLAPFGTTGEAASISEAERTSALWHLTKGGIDPAVMIPGTGMLDIGSTVSLSRSCLDMGCPAVMILPPHYYKTATEDGLFAWYAKVIEGVGNDVRVFLYNIPHMAGVALSVALVHRLREAFPQQVVGIKDSSGDAKNARALMRIEGLTVYLGSEMLAALTHAAGCAGTITATANLNAKAISDYIAAVEEGDSVGVEYLREPVGAAREAIALRGYIPTPKRILAMRTGDARWANVRPPFIEASHATAEALEGVLKDLTA